MVRVSSELLRNLRATVALLGESFRIVKTRGLFQASDFVTVGRGPGNVTKGCCRQIAQLRVARRIDFASVSPYLSSKRQAVTLFARSTA
jgi:hypothetical protein